MTSEAGKIIYKAFAPTLKMMICIIIGFTIAKQGNFPPASARGVSTLAMNIALPCLIFSSIVTAFTPENIAAFGSLAMVAILYELIGGLLGWIISELFYVPNDFRWGIIVMGFCSNWGNLPIAIVQTVGKTAPFNGDTDVELGVAYVSVFVLIMNTSFFPLGMHKLCALDWKEQNLLRAPPLPFKQRWASRFQAMSSPHLRKRRDSRSSSEVDAPRNGDVEDLRTAQSPDLPMEPLREKRMSSAQGSDHGEREEEPTELKHRAERHDRAGRYGGGSVPYRKPSRASSFHSMMESTRPIPPTEPLEAANFTQPCVPSTSASAGNGNLNAHNNNPLLPVCSTHGGQQYAYHQPVAPDPSMKKLSLGRRFMKLAGNILMPTTIAIILAVPCSIVLPLKALFLPVDGWTGTRIPNGPNDKPPLYFILETCTFVGGIVVPASLILLGASFARLKLPHSWRELPLGAIFAMATSKMIVVPVFGIFFVQGLRDHTSTYPKDDKMRTFVAILTSGTPTAINQLVVTQLYNPAGTAHTLAMFLLVQYICMPIFSTTLAAIALYICQ